MPRLTAPEVTVLNAPTASEVTVLKAPSTAEMIFIFGEKLARATVGDLCV